MIRQVDIAEFPRQWFVDFRPAIPFMDAVEAFENFPDTYSFASYCDMHGIPNNQLEEAIDVIGIGAPHLLPYIDRMVLDSL